jgi:L-amino acid N-acyltransferase YncA
VSGGVIVRDAGETDLPAILEIYNAAVLNETSIWNDDISDLKERHSWWQARTARGFPVYVADVDGVVSGYGTFDEFRPHQGYRFTVEHSIYVSSTVQRRGIGSVLLTRLIAEARRTNKHAMVGGIASDNLASLALHQRFGFVETARMPQVGFKFGRWLDLVLMQKLLAESR